MEIIRINVFRTSLAERLIAVFLIFLFFYILQKNIVLRCSFKCSGVIQSNIVDESVMSIALKIHKITLDRKIHQPLCQICHFNWLSHETSLFCVINHFA